MIKLKDLLFEERFNDVELIAKKNYLMRPLDFPNLEPFTVKYVGRFEKNGAVYYKFNAIFGRYGKNKSEIINLHPKNFKDYELTQI